LQKAVDRLLGRPEIQFALETDTPESRTLAAPGRLRFPLYESSGEPLAVQVSPEDAVTAGQALATGAAGFVLPSPVSGTVRAITTQPDIRGNRAGNAVLIEPSEGDEPRGFEPLDPESGAPEALAERLREAGILSAVERPLPLVDQLRCDGDPGLEVLVVSAADREPGVSATLELLRERGEDANSAALLLGRIAGTPRVVLALLEGEAARQPRRDGIELLPLPARYPETLPGALRRRLGAGVEVVPLEAALAALDAVREGRVQREKRLTLIGPDQEPVANYRVSLGTPIRDLLDHAGIEPGEHDKVVAGGPLGGFPLFSLDGAIDAGVDALTVIPAGRYPAWSTEPCINCGRCIDICPLDLQVQLIARYAEFELFDRTPEYDIEACFECGLCAVVCTGRRPLLQYIRLAKRGLEAPA